MSLEAIRGRRDLAALSAIVLSCAVAWFFSGRPADVRTLILETALWGTVAMVLPGRIRPYVALPVELGVAAFSGMAMLHAGYEEGNIPLLTGVIVSVFYERIWVVGLYCAATVADTHLRGTGRIVHGLLMNGMSQTIGLALLLFAVERYMAASWVAAADAATRAAVDPLSGAETKARWDQTAAGSGRVALIVFDLDRFRALNETYGTEAGDRALQETVRILRRLIRAADRIFRYGGEEFIILMPRCPRDTAMRRAEEMRRTLAGTPLLLGHGAAVHLTASFGVAAGRQNLSRLFDQADAALYQSKKNGRNQTTAAS